MTAAPTKRVFDALAAARPSMAAGDVARFVGGCVRNSLIGQPVDDIDIATILTPKEVIAALNSAGIHVIETGLAHGTVTAVADHQPFEITTLRRDVETDGRHAVVAFTDDWAEDAGRRDFRINAIYSELDGTLHDPVGGIADARAGRVVFIGDADRRIAEDHLRILRFFRFSAWYSNGRIDEAGLAACARTVSGIAALSVERVWKELKKLLTADDPLSAVEAMAASGVLAASVPDVDGLGLLQPLLAFEGQQFIPSDGMTRFAALIGQDEVAAQRLSRHLKLSNDERGRLRTACALSPAFASFMSLREARRHLYRLGRQGFEDRVRLAWAAEQNPRLAVQWRALLAVAASWTRPEMKLKGSDIMATGVAEGPKVGEVMREVEAWWIDADFTDDEFSIAERLKAVSLAFV
jgi:poly(A) polymerase